MKYGPLKESRTSSAFITTLGRFISKLGEHALPFFKLLKKSRPIQWTLEADAALQELKEYLTSPPILVVPKPGELLLLYVAATSQVVSAMLMAEREEDPKVAKPKAQGCFKRPGLGSPPPEEAAEESSQETRMHRQGDA
jgi:hypothetical protein